MIKTALKHYLYDIGINMFFDNIRNNFATTHESYVDGFWMAVDDENYVIAYGKCTEQFGNLIVLDDGESESIIHVNLFHMHAITEYEVSLFRKIENEEDEDYDEKGLDKPI